ncbi:MAG TPA: WecB/TagA/CpsF family glycosyltransferase [Candidatus Dormibacteraeota bacterium]
MVPILTMLFLALGAPVLLASAYLALVAVAALRKAPPGRPASPALRLAVVVPAHDEEALIESCVRSLLEQDYARERFGVFVVADNCGDSTAARAAAAGARVMVRTDPERRGKGQVLRWAFDQLLAGQDRPEALIVVDADSVVAPGFLRAVSDALASGAEVAQAAYTGLAGPGAGAQLAAAAFLLFNVVRLAGRATLGWPANLVGNGMAFRAEVLDRVPWSAFTAVEDLEYSLRLRVAGVRPRYVPAARVSGPILVVGGGQEAGQRRRWEGGRFHIARRWLPRLAAEIAGGRLDLLDAGADLAVPPLSVLAIGLIGGTTAAALAVAGGVAAPLSLAPWVASFVLLAAFALVGLRAGGAPREAYVALIKAPGFVLAKAWLYAGLLLHRHDAAAWERAVRPGSSSPDAAQRVEVLGVAIDAIDTEEAVRRIVSAPPGAGVLQACTVNLDFLVHAHAEPDVAQIFASSQLNLADGAPVLWMARLLGRPLPARVAGADLVPRLAEASARTGCRLFLLGGEEGVAEEARARLLQAHPGAQIVGVYQPARAAIAEMDNDEILARIEQAGADVLLVAFGHPKQERWIAMHRARLSVRAAIGVGCCFDLIAGRRRRAPAWMQAVGLEWSYRFLQEPGRLGTRYLRDGLWLLTTGFRTALAARARVA